MTDQCNRHSAAGSRCTLPEGHEGNHFRAWENRPGGFWWDDASQTKLMDDFNRPWWKR